MGSDCAIIPMNNKNRIMRSGFFMGRGGFEPPKQVAADLQSVPFGHSGICPFRQGIALTLRKYTIFTLFTQVLIPLIFTQLIFTNPFSFIIPSIAAAFKVRPQGIPINVPSPRRPLALAGESTTSNCEILIQPSHGLFISYVF